MQTRNRLRQSLVISRRAAEARRPREAALDHPSARQEDEAPPGLLKLHHFEADAMRLGVSRSRLARVALAAAKALYEPAGEGGSRGGSAGQ